MYQMGLVTGMESLLQYEVEIVKCGLLWPLVQSGLYTDDWLILFLQGFSWERKWWQRTSVFFIEMEFDIEDVYILH